MEIINLSPPFSSMFPSVVLRNYFCIQISPLPQKGTQLFFQSIIIF